MTAAELRNRASEQLREFQVQQEAIHEHIAALERLLESLKTRPDEVLALLQLLQETPVRGRGR